MEWLINYIDVIFMSTAALLFLVSLYTKRGMWLSSIVMAEFLFSNTTVAALIDSNLDDKPWFQLMYTSLGVIYVLIGMFLSLFYLILRENKHLVAVGVLYFIAGIVLFLAAIQKMPFYGVYYLNNIGAYEHLEVIMTALCVLILTTTGHDVVGGNGIRNLYRLFSYNSFNNFFGVLRNKKRSSRRGI